MIDMSSGALTLGTYVFWPVAVICLAALIACIVGFFTGGDTDVIAAGVFVSLLVLAVSAWAYWPVFDMTYHRWYPVTGTVAEAPDSRLIAHDKRMQQRMVIRFTESATIFGCDDSRCAAARKGDTLHLRCRKEWQYQADAGWACRYSRSS